MLRADQRQRYPTWPPGPKIAVWLAHMLALRSFVHWYKCRRLLLFFLLHIWSIEMDDLSFSCVWRTSDTHIFVRDAGFDSGDRS
jgi:hypothetical protein